MVEGSRNRGPAGGADFELDGAQVTDGRHLGTHPCAGRAQSSRRRRAASHGVSTASYGMGDPRGGRARVMAVGRGPGARSGGTHNQSDRRERQGLTPTDRVAPIPRLLAEYAEKPDGIPAVWPHRPAGLRHRFRLLGDRRRLRPIDAASSSGRSHRALDLGINCFDTAEGYGMGVSEQALGHALGAAAARRRSSSPSSA